MTTSAERPVALQVNPEGIPEELKLQDTWVCWRYFQKDGNWTKPPYTVDGDLASTTDPKTWTAFERVLSAYQNPKNRFDGIGIRLTDGFAGIDLDHVFINSDAIDLWACTIRDAFDGTYTEWSPSAHGMRILLRGSPRRCGKGGPNNRIEVYEESSPRYLTITGRRLSGSGTHIVEAQSALDWLHETYMKKEPPKKAVAGKPTLLPVDDEIVRKAQAAKNGAKFSRLWSADTGGYADDHSSADLALCSLLKFWTQDAGQLDRLFRKSGLMREKWDERHGQQTYGEMTIAKALESVTETYSPISNGSKPQKSQAPNVPGGESKSAHVHVSKIHPLDDVHAFIGRFVAFPSGVCRDAVTLWAAHAHMVEHFHTTPRLAALSPEPESGKTRVLEILDLLVPNPMLIFSPSVAAIFRKLAQEQMTMLFDEVDTIFTKRGKDDQNEDLRALLNAGYRRGASIPRCVGPKHEVQDFKVFAATALAGIGDLPDTIMTRAIVIRMRRRSATEQIEPFRLRLHEGEGHQLRDALATWAEAVGAAVGNAWPALPDGVVDRRAEAWEPLIAVADAAGGTWPERARVAAVADVAAYSTREPTLGIRLLSDLRGVFGDREVMSTEEVLKALNALDEAPWADLRGKPLDSRGLAMRLKRYGVASKNVRISTAIPKGYARADLHEVWQRYLPSHPLGAATSATCTTNVMVDDAEVEL